MKATLAAREQLNGQLKLYKTYTHLLFIHICYKTYQKVSFELYAMIFQLPIDDIKLIKLNAVAIPVNLLFFLFFFMLLIMFFYCGTYLEKSFLYNKYIEQLQVMRNRKKNKQ